jgi:hypothetical protein
MFFKFRRLINTIILPKEGLSQKYNIWGMNN